MTTKGNAFEQLFNNSYQPLYVDKSIQCVGEATKFSSIEQALLTASPYMLIKISTGLYIQNIYINSVDTKLQSHDASSNVTLIATCYPLLTVNLPTPQSRISLQSLKLAHLCQQQRNTIKWPSLKDLKEYKYIQLQVGPHLNCCLHVKKGTVYLEECRLSLAAHKDGSRLTPCIVVEEMGTCIMSRCEIIGGVGTVGVYCRGGKVVMRECVIKGQQQGIGLCISGRGGDVVVKNSVITHCEVGIVLNGPFNGNIQSNTIQCESGIICMGGNSSNIVNNQFTSCEEGIIVQNSAPKILKNNIVGCKEVAISLYSLMHYLCWPTVNFNTINENNGGILVHGARSKAMIANNILKYNKNWGIRVQIGGTPHIFHNQIENTLGNGVQVLKQASAFLEKNLISGSLNSNIVIEGPNNIDNCLYSNKITLARGNGVFLQNCERFMMAKNEICLNYNGIFSSTSVCVLEENNIHHNKCNGVMLIHDNEIEMTQNSIVNNKKAGVVCRNTSRAHLYSNTFADNKYELVIETDHQILEDVDKNNQFQGELRIPTNYQCNLI